MTYTIEVPLYTEPLQTLIDYSRYAGIDFNIYAGYPDSPFNGGRNNFLMGGYIPKHLCSQESTVLHSFIGNRQALVDEAIESFCESLTKINQEGISFHLVMTNLFFQPEELTEKNLYPLRKLVECGKKCGVKNGVILYNDDLKKNLEKDYGDDLIFLGSCARYFDSDRMLSPQETMARYRKDLAQFDTVVLTPQDSFNRQIMEEMSPGNEARVMAICNILCGRSCESYWHFEVISKGNKTSIIDYTMDDVTSMLKRFDEKLQLQCRRTHPTNIHEHIRNNIILQLKAGITSFKIGRGYEKNASSPLKTLIQSIS
jgi:hypothetical protein